MKQRLKPDETEARFNDLLDKYELFLRNTIARICPKNLGLQISDILQEARLQLWRVIESEIEIAHPVSYIYRVAVSVTLRAIQRAKRRREEQLRLADDEDDSPSALDSLAVAPSESPEALAERRELVGQIEEAMGSLQENRRLAVGLYLKGLTTEDIAELMQWSEPKARNLVYRGLKDLREQLRAKGIDYS
ncbi:MAG TPA: sigma-70 family RNA polymerase sigma factor [Blastocatellia bacterium]|nr:sigma-70 family RNA polymerase sigma factor [Blastocatellia bacterium]